MYLYPLKVVLWELIIYFNLQKKIFSILSCFSFFESMLNKKIGFKKRKKSGSDLFCYFCWWISKIKDQRPAWNRPELVRKSKNVMQKYFDRDWPTFFINSHYKSYWEHVFKQDNVPIDIFNVAVKNLKRMMCIKVFF